MAVKTSRARIRLTLGKFCNTLATREAAFKFMVSSSLETFKTAKFSFHGFIAITPEPQNSSSNLALIKRDPYNLSQYKLIQERSYDSLR